MSQDEAMDLGALRDGVRDVLDREASSERLHRFIDGEALIDQALWDEAAGLGWFSLAVAEAHDGLGLGPVEMAVVFEELGRRTAPLPLLGACLAARAIALGGSEAQQAAWLPRLAAGAVTCAVSLPPVRGQARLSADGDGWVLDGEASDLLEGATAALLVVQAADPAGAPAWVLVEADAPGVAITAERTVDRTRHLARARFDGVRRAGDRRLAADVSGALAAEAALAIACDAIGGARESLHRTVEYLKVREQFGKPIGVFQALKHRCADHAVAIAACAAVVGEAVRLHAAQDPEAAVMVPLAKAYAGEVYAKAAEDAVQLHGGIGFTWEHDCHIFLKRAKLDQALLGGTAGLLDQAARRLAA